jgi:hypothetical protein
VVTLGLVLVPTASATKPEPVEICFAFALPNPDWNYCIWQSEDPLLVGCVVQPEAPGRAAHGTFYSFAFTPVWDGMFLKDLPGMGEINLRGTCEYNLATYNIPGRGEFAGQPVLAMNRCTGDLEGMHGQTKAPPAPEPCMDFDIHWEPR